MANYRCLCVFYSEALLVSNMMQRITNIIKEYQDRVRELPYVPATSFRRDSLGYPCDANKLFLTFLFSDRNIDIQFLKDIWLTRSKVQCNSSSRHMTSYADPSKLDGFRSRCRRMGAETGCYGSRSIRHGSWFHGSNLTLQRFCTSRTTSSPVSSWSDATWLTAVHFRQAAASRYSGMRAQASLAAILPPCFPLRLGTSPI